MGQKIYSFADATSPGFAVAGNFAITTVFPTATPASSTLASRITNPGPGHWEFLVNEANITRGIVLSSAVINLIGGLVVSTFALNYTTHIPPTALITKVTFRLPRSLNLLFGVDIAAHGIEQFQLNGSFFTTSIPLAVYPGLSHQLLESYAGSAADIVQFDYLGVPANRLTRGQLIASYSAFNTNITSMNICSRTAANAGLTTDVDMIGTISMGDGWTVIIDYDEAFSFTFPDPEVDGVPVTVEPEQVLTLIPAVGTDPDEVLVILLQPLDIDSNPIGSPINVPFTVVAGNIVFTVPSFPSTTYYASFSLTSTQFSGSLALGQKLVLYFYNAPGIYRFVPGQRFDTYYNRPDEGIGDEDTFNTAIPRPFVKTGYL